MTVACSIHMIFEMIHECPEFFSYYLVMFLQAFDLVPLCLVYVVFWMLPEIYFLKVRAEISLLLLMSLIFISGDNGFIFYDISIPLVEILLDLTPGLDG